MASGLDPTKVPSVTPPTGVKPNFDNPPSKAFIYYIVASISTALMTFFVILRLYVRSRITRALWWDDLTAVLALLSQAAYTGLVIQEGTLGLGTHAWDLTLAKALEFYKYAEPSAILTAPAIYFTKLTLLLLYLRLFSLNQGVNIGIWAGIVFCSIYYTIVFFLFIFVKDNHKLTLLTYSVAVIGVVSDVYIICLPLVAVTQLHLDTARKWRVATVFLTGLLGVVMSFLGCIYRFQFDIKDNTYSLLSIYIVNTVEVDIGIICTCLPVMAALFRNNMKKSWWLTSMRSLRTFLVRSTPSSTASSNKSSRSHFSTGRNRRNVVNNSSDNIQLVTIQTGEADDPLPIADVERGHNETWPTRTVQQGWKHSETIDASEDHLAGKGH
ncbi:uncharacterized protein TRUGW13939_00733 [Talaromyces rugulosus]|uniref:Rhodopsin domain-containing protein n=1 Tax=Talaromyces rugulosus TaxID=121627 RepID=A0A7H8QI43_TALRU|nr:uncharacterized protein TRUGW13939_00733 [Talaromyces rugulosus]QKX53654.1 hypothetical protein TRUGW13939_00733 [Talaromyces rugulosus]